MLRGDENQNVDIGGIDNLCITSRFINSTKNRACDIDFMNKDKYIEE